MFDGSKGHSTQIPNISVIKANVKQLDNFLYVYVYAAISLCGMALRAITHKKT